MKTRSKRVLIYMPIIHEQLNRYPCIFRRVEESILFCINPDKPITNYIGRTLLVTLYDNNEHRDLEGTPAVKFNALKSCPTCKQRVSGKVTKVGRRKK